MEFFRIGHAGVAQLDVLDQLIIKLLRPVGYQLCFQAPCGGTAQGREESRCGHIQVLQCRIDNFFEFRNTLGITHQYPGQWTYFHGVPFPAGCFEEAVFFFRIQVLVRRFWTRIVELGFSFPGVQTYIFPAFIRVPGFVDEFLNLAVFPHVHFVYFGQVLVQNSPSRELEGTGIAEPICWQIAVHQVVAQATTDCTPIFVKRGHGQEVRNVYLLDEAFAIVQQLFDIRQAFGIDGTHIIQANGAGHPAYEVVGVRVFAAKNGLDFDNLFLPFQCFQVMRQANQVDFSW